MAKTKTSTEEIIEKKESTPVASASLVLSFVAILAAIVFCLLEVTEYRTGLSASVADSQNPGDMTAKRDLLAQELKVNRIVNNQASPEDDADFDADDADFDADDADDADIDEDDADFDEEEEEDEDF